MVVDGLLASLARLGQFSDPLAWVVIGTFLAGAVLEWTDRREQARPVSVAGWALFGLFWFSLIYHFVVVQRSIVEGIGSILAVPLSLYVGYLLWSGRDSLFVLSRAIPAMGLIFFPFETIPALQRPLIEMVTRQTEFLMGLTGHDPEVVSTNGPYRNTFVFLTETDHTGLVEVSYTIILACTGIGSMSIFGGLVAAVEAPLGRKLRALAVSLPVIYVLNLVRNVFIGVTFGKQYLHVFPDAVLTVFASGEVPRVSYYVGDRLLAQSLSVVALVGITYLVVRELPEILDVLDDMLYVVTGREWELADAMAVEPEAAGDGPAVRAEGGD